MRIGIDIGGSHIGLGIVNENGEILFKNEENYSLSKTDMSLVLIEKITKLIEKTIKENGIDNKKIEAIGIGFPGTVSNGIIIRSKKFGIENLKIKEKIEQKYEIPVYVKNDAKCAGMAEKKIWKFKKL